MKVVLRPSLVSAGIEPLAATFDVTGEPFLVKHHESIWAVPVEAALAVAEMVITPEAGPLGVLQATDGPAFDTASVSTELVADRPLVSVTVS